MAMKSEMPIRIAVFEPCYQGAVKSLVLDGLGRRWGELDKDLNPDLDNIAHSYSSGHFLVALHGGQVVGTGALIPESQGVMRVVRMSTAVAMRNKGIGTRMLEELLLIARNHGCKQVVLETTATWHDAVHFYLDCGFRIVAEQNGDLHFALDLV